MNGDFAIQVAPFVGLTRFELPNPAASTALTSA
jgi:hypothetical protein